MLKSSLWQMINKAYLVDETQHVKYLLQASTLNDIDRDVISQQASRWVSTLRQHADKSDLNESFMREYDLSSDEGIILMSLAEALLRIPDAPSAQQLIHDYLSKGNWLEHLGQSSSHLVNFSSWGLKLSQQVVTLSDENPAILWRRLASRLGVPVVQQAIANAMGLLGRQFVMGETIDKALNRSATLHQSKTLFSYDMLGEEAVSAVDAQSYYETYFSAIQRLSLVQQSNKSLYQRDGISVKLSALHPRYHYSQQQRLIDELTPKVLTLALQAKQAGITLIIDAEECERLDLSLAIFYAVYSAPSLKGWEGFGFALQAYQKRAIYVVDWLVDLAKQQQRKIPVRLVKGAYWDSEIKLAQQQGLSSYPVFTRKQSTDLSYLVCAERLLASDTIYAQFATHNAYSIAAISVLAEKQGTCEFEFQRLHGMGDSLYQIVCADKPETTLRIYAPVGGHSELLPYLVRRLLENGANSSFVNRIWDESVSIDDVVADPISYTEKLTHISHPDIPLPSDIFGKLRRNAQGFNLSDDELSADLISNMQQSLQIPYQVVAMGQGMAACGENSESYEVFNPANSQQLLATVQPVSEEPLVSAFNTALHAVTDWQQREVKQRADILFQVAELLEKNNIHLLALLVTEAGKTLDDAIAELREAVDFCRYYAAQILNEQQAPIEMPGPVGEDNLLYWSGRGLFVAISPWNFPLAIFTGQIAAALASGNCVLAKPAHQTCIMAQQIVQLFYEAGTPQNVLYLLPTSGSLINKCILSKNELAGVVFTGSTDTAQQINRTLAQRSGAIIPLIAETGGQNAMLVDSSALPEQVVKDVIRSAFNSAGQRCSALRVLYLQEEIAERVIELLIGAMAELVIGDPQYIKTDVGPVIDEEAYDKLVLHAAQLEAKGRLLYQTPLANEQAKGFFVPPTLFEISSINDLVHEVFGPMLHVVKYRANELNEVINDINQYGYGLTLGIHSRIEQRIKTVTQAAHVGNLYINRDMVGAVVGVQPFGGEGLSGTGFKAGGPHYLYRFSTERSVSINSAAIGGNTQLLNLQDHD